MNNHLWIILGGSSPIAKAFSSQVAQQGSSLLLVGRDEADLNITASDIHLRYGVESKTLGLDLSDSSQHAQIFELCRDANKVSLFFAYAVMPEESKLSAGQIEQVFMTNTISPIQLLNKATSIFPADKLGHIIFLSSVAGDRGRKKNCLYGASKAAMNTYIQGWRIRYPKHKLLLVKPGFIDTLMTYGQDGVFYAASPRDCATACLRAAMKNKTQMYFPGFWKLIMLGIRLIPEKIFKYLPI